MPQEPEVSVVIASYNSKRTVEACLKSLEEQITPRDYEVILVDSSTDGTGELVERKYPRVMVHRCSERKFAGDARNLGISKARGKLIAFLDADCQAESDWIEKIAEAHESPYPAIGGAIANGTPDSYVGCAAYFCEFSGWMPGLISQLMDDIAGANMSYKKDIFDKYGYFIEGTYCSDTEFHWRLGKNGLRLRFDPSVRISHYNIDRLGKFLNHEMFHGRCFAEVRIRAQRFSRLRRLIYVAFSPLLPVRLFYNITLNSIENGTYFRRFLWSSPLVLLGVICWSLGEALGYARGLGENDGAGKPSNYHRPEIC
ncbi:MAG: glycosyltransferase [Deltaproteobacteria bacterium]|nr:glycosyltransferase [Deltaproteobacteria bacterium]